MRTLPLLALGVILVSPSAAWADLIHLKAGGTLKGKILKRTASEVVVQLDFGTISFTPAEIAGVDPEPLPEPQPVHTAVEVPPQEEPAPIPQDAVVPPSPPQGAPVPPPLQVVPSPPAAAAPAEASKTLEPSQRAEEPAGVTLPEAMKAVAFVAVLFEDGSIGMGSGTIINDRGTMVTNFHVVQGATKVAAALWDPAKSKSKTPKSYEARVVKTDPCYDLALLTIPVKTPAYFHFAADDEGIRAGEVVRAIGNPQGLAISVSQGIISAVRTLKEMGAESADLKVPACEHLSERTLEDMTLIQTDAAINPGNSGGPLLNRQNKVVGINTLMYTESGGSQGLNFALHVKHVKRFVGSYAGKGK